MQRLGLVKLLEPAKAKFCTTRGFVGSRPGLLYSPAYGNTDIVSSRLGLKIPSPNSDSATILTQTISQLRTRFEVLG